MAGKARSTSTDDLRVLLLAMAFGQGAGTMLASDEALGTALDFFKERVDKLDSTAWEKYALRIVEFARAMGTVSATLAAQDRQLVIRGQDVTAAISPIRNRVESGVLGICGC